MNLKNKFIVLFSIGFSLGVIGCLIITSITTTTIINDGKTYICDPAFTSMIGNELIAFIIQSIVSGLYAGCCVGGTVLYDIEDWSILKATITHFVITFVLFNITAVFLKWYSPSIVSNIILFGIMVGIYFLIWIIQYLIYKREIKEIKTDIKIFRKKNKTK